VILEKLMKRCVFLPLQESPLQEKSRSADADVAGMARYCNAIPDRLENLPNFSFQKEKGQFQHRTLPCPIYTSNP